MKRGLDVKGGIRSTQVENHVNKKKEKAKIAVTILFFRSSPDVALFAVFILFVPTASETHTFAT